jgi:DNA-binding MarR family transcriptional regulator
MMRASCTPGEQAERAASARVDAVVVDDQLCFALYAASRAATAVYRPHLEKLGLTYPRYLALLVLWERDEISVKELGERLFLDSGTLTPLLKSLAAGGLIERTRDTADERIVRIALTKKGRELRERSNDVVGAISCKLDLSGGQIAALRAEIWDLFNKLSKASEDMT